MSTVSGVLLAVHGLIHLVGLTRPNAVLWGTAAALFFAAAEALFLWPRWWWAVGAAAVAVSTIPIAQNWTEAHVGAAVNAVILTGVVFGFLAQGPFSLRAQYDRDVRWGLDRPAHPTPCATRISPVFRRRSGGTFAGPASSISRACAVFTSGCTAASVVDRTRHGCRSPPSRSMWLTRRRGSSI
jgi:hypothetical protein